MFELEAPAPYRLEDPPLAQALVQLRFPLQARLSSLEGIAPIQAELSPKYPVLNRRVVQGIQVDLPVDGSPQAAVGEQSVNYHFTSEDGFQIVLSPDQATLAADKRYRGVEDFLQRFTQLLLILQNTVRVPRIDRIGVRYISVVDLSGSDERATDWFKPELVGWADSEIVRAETSVQIAMQQTALISPPSGDLSEFPASIEFVARHGIVPPGSRVPATPDLQISTKTFLLDLDASCTSPIACKVEPLVANFRALHGQIDRFFRWSLTSAGETHFKLEGA